MNGAERITTERQRQVELEGWTPEHDDEHDRGEMTRAAGCYVDVARTAVLRDDAAYYHRHGHPEWPWDDSWWKPSDDPIRNLVKAGALIAAEIDRLQRRRADA